MKKAYIAAVLYNSNPRTYDLGHMKRFLFLMLTVSLTTLVVAAPSRALTLEIHDRNQGVTRFDLPAPHPNSDAGAVTINAFHDHNIPFEGSAGGITSIYGQGSDLEVISDKVMKAWGWCFAIDDKVGDKMPDQVELPAAARVLKWFYAYALYDSGAWTGYCIQDQ